MSNFKINRNGGHEFSSGERVDWLDRFADSCSKQKSAVEVARERSIYEQISSIISGRPAHTSVESKIQDMQERVGLTEYLKRVSSEKEKTKTASEFSEILENVVDDELKEKVATFCRNKIETYRGHISVAAIQAEIISTFKNQGIDPKDINDPRTASVINTMIKEEKDRNPGESTNDTSLGLGVGIENDDDDDNSNSDFWAGLMPNTK